MTAFLSNIPLYNRYTQTGAFARFQHALLQTGSHCRMEYLKLADLQRRTSGIRYNNILTCLRLLCQCCAHVNILDRKVDNRSIRLFRIAHARKVRQKNGGNRYLIFIAHLVTCKTCQIDRGLRQSEVRQPFGIQCDGNDPFLPFLQDIGFYFRLQIGRQMHQHGFVWAIGQVHYPDMHHRLLTGLYIGKIKTVLVNTYLSDEVWMGFGKVLDFTHHLTVELQIDQMGLCIAVNGYGFVEMPQSLRIKSDVDCSLCSRGDRCLCPLGHGTGTIGFHLGKHQRPVTRVCYGILYRHRMFPFNLPEIIRFRIRGKTRLSYGSQCRSCNRI